MSANNRHRAFTFLEVLMILIIMTLLAISLIPQFLSYTNEAKKSSLNFNLHTIRSQLEKYKAQHNGLAPALTNLENQLTKPTDINGATTGAAGVLIYGPYLQGKIPVNPFVGRNTLAPVDSPGKEPTAIVSGGAGWQYDESTGGFYPNNAEYYTGSW